MQPQMELTSEPEVQPAISATIVAPLRSIGAGA